MNFTFFVAGIMGLVAMTCSAMRGIQKKYDLKGDK
jgi:hypothetical protein